MSYISYFDLLGTRGFCENRNTYYKNITSFYDVIHQESCFLKGCGSVGIFSDCAYAESSSLERLLDFIVEVRDQLISQGLFFNAVITKGNLGIKDIPQDENRPSFGVVFSDSMIADLYISQTRFKGIGISVDKLLVDEINKNTSYKTTNCIFIDKINREGRTQFVPVEYFDIKFDYDGYSKEMEHTLDIFYHEFYSAYIKSPHFGRYYISALSNFIRSYECKLKWNMEKCDFENPRPLVYKVIQNTLNKCKNELSDLPCIEYLALVLLDEIYNSTDLTPDEKKDITKQIVEIECVKKKFIHSLNEIPYGVFTNNLAEGINNRNIFIQYCQEDLSDDFVEKLFEIKMA